MHQGSSPNISIAAKDYEILGVVRGESQVRMGSGEKITYDALLLSNLPIV
jgi:hypothetical protein